MRDKNESIEISKTKLQEKKAILDKALGGKSSDVFMKNKIHMMENKALAISTLVNVVAVSALVLVVIGGDHNSFGVGGNSSYKSDINNASTKSNNTPVVRENISPIKYGFNTHVHSVLDSLTDNMTLETYKKGIDILASNNMNIVRLDIRAKEFVEVGTSPTKVKFNDNVLVYDEAIRYSKEKGLDIFLVTNMPEYAKNYSHSDYKKVADDYYTKLITRYSDQLDGDDVIQIFNEPNKHSFRDHTEMNLPLNPTYLRELSDVIATASRAIKKVDSEVIVTTNLSYWVGRNENLYEFGPAFFDQIKGIDAISLNLFPDNKLDEIARLPEYIKFFSDRYQKPVFLAEIGLPTLVFTQSDQADSLSRSIDMLQNGEVRPAGIVIHELIDVTAPQKEAERTFGIYYSNGTPKSSAFPVINSMLDDELVNN